MITSKVTDHHISSAQLAEEVSNLEAGAVVTFSGEVRNHDNDREVSRLTYEIHPTAHIVIQNIAEEVASRHEITGLAVNHRFGAILLGETALAVAVSAVHRKSAFECCMELVDRIKKDLPIWKFQEFSDGTSEWVNSS